jgi:antitoxin CcdA
VKPRKSPNPPVKVPTNLSIRSDLIRLARSLNLNLSQLLEQALEQLLRERARQSWLEQNEDAIDDYNAQVEKRGVFSDGWRKF